MKLILPTTFFGPVKWYEQLCTERQAEVQQYENYQKQTLRNRCIIATANGLQALSVPVEKDARHNCLVRDVRIASHGNWQRHHWQALCTAYGESPFFDYYADDLRPFFEKTWQFLIDYNMEIVHTMCRLLDLDAQLSLSQDYSPCDTQSLISPQKLMADDNSDAHHLKPYWQLHHRKLGFIPNLSILDLLFCMGNEAILCLKTADDKPQFI